MSLKLPQAPGAYDQANESQTRAAIERAHALVLNANQDLRLQPGVRLTLRSPDGTEWRLSASNGGALTLEPYP